jgi:hypothetical protein
MAYCMEHLGAKIFTSPAKILFTATIWGTRNLSRKICSGYFDRLYYLEYTFERNIHFWNILCACKYMYSVLFCDHAGFSVHLLQHQPFITKLITLVITHFTELKIIFVFLKFVPHKNLRGKYMVYSTGYKVHIWIIYFSFVRQPIFWAIWQLYFKFV